MKTLKFMLAGMAMLLICVSVNASVKPGKDKLTKDQVVNMYIMAVTQGKVNGLPDIIDDDFKFNTLRGESVNSLNKDQFIEYLKGNQNFDPSVTTTVSVIDEGDDAAKTKVVFKFADYVRTDIIDFTGSKNTKIISVDSSYK
jgi:hypothetical protein